MLSAMRTTHFIAFATVRAEYPWTARTPERFLHLQGNGTAFDLQNLAVDEDIGD
jgi:hypothetical protein